MQASNTALMLRFNQGEPVVAHPAQHLLSRTLLACDRRTMDGAMESSIEDSVNDLLKINKFEGWNELPLKDYLTTADDPADEHVKLGTTWLGHPSFHRDTNAQRKRTVIKWLTGCQYLDNFSLRPVMIEFWLDFFNIDLASGSSAEEFYYFYKTIADHCCHNFIDLFTCLLTEKAVHAHFKKNRPSGVSAIKHLSAYFFGALFFPDQPGKSLLTPYKEKKCSKLLNLWIAETENDPRTGHEPGAREHQFRKAASRAIFAEIRELVAGLFRAEVTTQMIARKMIRYFVAAEPAGNEASTLAGEIRKNLRKEDFQLEPILRTLFTHPLFYAPGHRANLRMSYKEYVFHVLKRTGTIKTQGDLLLEDYSIWDWISKEIFFLTTEKNMGKSGKIFLHALVHYGITSAQGTLRPSAEFLYPDKLEGVDQVRLILNELFRTHAHPEDEAVILRQLLTAPPSPGYILSSVCSLPSFIYK